MSTRCNIVITHGSSTVYLYRHSDGYLAEAGADLLLKILAAIGPAPRVNADGIADKFLRALMAEHYDQQSYETAPRPVYQLTTELHGDIEHVYYIDIAECPHPVNLRHAERPRDYPEVEAWASRAAAVPYPLPMFRNMVNYEREDHNRRLAKLQRDNPGSAYRDCAPYPMIQERA